jgi:acid phosphatase
MSVEYKIIRIVIIVIAALYFAGCNSSNDAVLQNLDTAKKLVQNYYESGEFDKECKLLFDDAKSQIEKLTLDKNSAVIFDVDETALSNYNNTKEIGFGYVREHWHNGILKADEPAIPETKKFYDWLISKNIRVIFLTGRYDEVREATIQNLIYTGYTKFDTLIVRNYQESKIPAAEFKPAKRNELVEKGYNIIACVGDQWSDLVGGNTGIKIKLPNYLYLID